MVQSTFTAQTGLHVGIIMDGNGRWATQRGLPRVAGHRAGAKVTRQIIESAPDNGVAILTLYAFSADNWKRPAHEVSALMRLFAEYLRTETPRCLENGVRLSIIGRRDRLPASLVRIIEKAEARTRDGQRLHLRIALDYSARDAIVMAAQALADAGQPITRDTLDHAITQSQSNEGALPNVDLIIRTGGEQRLSDFLLWESAYAEFMFLPQMWPEFTPDDLGRAVQYFYRRERRFGGLLEPVA
jgi:undecaprenyl diphosphate synthase